MLLVDIVDDHLRVLGDGLQRRFHLVAHIVDEFSFEFVGFLCFIAGGALMGVVSAILKFANVDWYLYSWNSVAPGAGASGAEMIAIIPLVLLCAYMIVSSIRAKK